MNDITITRRVEFDAGHRIPDHASKCRNVHGHRYVLEVTVKGPVNNQRGLSDDGMVVDYGDLKAIIMRFIGEPWDHAFLVFDGDLLMRGALAVLGDQHKTVVLPFVPTAENLVAYVFELLEKVLAGRGFTLSRVELWETPNCRAERSA